MNRRDFVKALAGIPLLGLLVKVLEGEDELKLGGYPDLGSYVSGIMRPTDSAKNALANLGVELYETAYAELQVGAEEQRPYELSFGNGETGIRYGDWENVKGQLSVWNGQEWIRVVL